MDYGFAPCEGFSNKNISGERFKIRTIREQEKKNKKNEYNVYN